MVKLTLILSLTMLIESDAKFFLLTLVFFFNIDDIY